MTVSTRAKLARLHIAARALVMAMFCAALGLCVPADSGAGEPDFQAASEAARRPAPSPAPNASSAGVAAADIVPLEEKLNSDHRKWAVEFKQKSFEWHLVSTKIIFALVIIIVGFGLFITYLQFRKDYTDESYRHLPAVEPKPTEGDPAAAAPSVPSRSVTSMKLGPGGLELSSQIIGLAVLAFSLGFFYLYVKNVYPMTEIGVAATAEKAEKAAAQADSKASK